MFYFIYFYSVEGEVYSQNITSKIYLKYKTLRRLQELIEEEVECIFMESQFKKMKYKCSFNVYGKEIEFLKHSLIFKFSGQEVELLSYTGIALEQSNNLLEISSNIFEKKLYILDNSILYLYNDNYNFNINGTMNDESFNNDKIILSFNFDDNKNISLNASCSSIKSNLNTYFLNCISMRVISGKIKFGFSSFENENLLVIIINQTESTLNKSYLYRTKENSKKKIATIIGIIIAILIVVISIIFTFYYLKKKKANSGKTKQDSSINYLNNNSNL